MSKGLSCHRVTRSKNLCWKSVVFLMISTYFIRHLFDLLLFVFLICVTLLLRSYSLQIRTSRRVYSLLAESKADADVWLEKILTALRD